MGRDAEPSDPELIRRVAAGDDAAARTLFDRHLPTLRARVRGRLPAGLRGKVGASDVIQEAYIAAFLGLTEFDARDDGAFGRWVRGILDHKIADEVRRHVAAGKRDARREVPLPRSTAGFGIVESGLSPSGEAMDAEERARIRRAVGALPDDQGTVVRLVHDEGLTLVEAGARMGRSGEAARKLYGRALARLADLLGDPEETSS